MEPRSRSDALYKALFARDAITLGELQQASFGGVPDHHRAVVWKLLLGYLPLEKASRQAKLDESRAQYRVFLDAIAERRSRVSRAVAYDIGRAVDDVLADVESVAETSGSSSSPSAESAQRSADGEGPGAAVSEDDELRGEIDKDISRTNPDLDWFTRDEHTAPMRRILFVYAKLNSGVR